MARGDDGRVWFANFVGGTIDAIDTAGNVDVHTVDLKDGLLNYDVAQGTDHMWFTAFNPGSSQGFIGHLALGKVTLYPTSSVPLYITRGVDEMWFGGNGSGQIDKISQTGVITSFALHPTSNVQGLVRGPDGNIWFTDFDGTGVSRIGRITPLHGKVTEFTVPDTYPDVIGITVGPDGNLWFTDGNFIGSCTVSGAITLYPIPTQSQLSFAITAGPAGDLYFTENGSIGRVTLNPVTITEYQAPFPNANPTGIALGADNNIWFTLPQTGNIGRFSTH